MRVDLYTNGPLGMWALDQVDADEVGRVVTPSAEIRQAAKERGLGGVSVARRALSFHYPTILKPSELAAYEVVYNIHPALLPWGKCYYPVFWALWAGEPAGCTLHVVDEGIDSGPIVAQRAVAKHEWDTGGTLHARVSEAEKGLFLEYWPRIVAGEELPATPQPKGGSFHYRDGFMALKERAVTGQMSGDEVLRLVRCLSHPTYSGMVLPIGGRQYEVSARPWGW